MYHSLILHAGLHAIVYLLAKWALSHFNTHPGDIPSYLRLTSKKKKSVSHSVRVSIGMATSISLENVRRDNVSVTSHLKCHVIKGVIYLHSCNPNVIIIWCKKQGEL